MTAILLGATFALATVSESLAQYREQHRLTAPANIKSTTAPMAEKPPTAPTAQSSIGRPTTTPRPAAAVRQRPDPEISTSTTATAKSATSLRRSAKERPVDYKTIEEKHKQAKVLNLQEWYKKKKLKDCQEKYQGYSGAIFEGMVKKCMDGQG
jgi:hypothetical protein